MGKLQRSCLKPSERIGLFLAIKKYYVKSIDYQALSIRLSHISPNGTIDKYIFEGEKAASLDWGMKFKIAVGAARGIEYLHGGCDMKILHLDIKPHNILLDENFVPKISDFGLAKLYPTDKDTVTLTTARGTVGLVAPEIIDTRIGRVSHKADVYSFGMLLMEIAGVNKGMTRNTNNSSQYFPYWVYDRLNRGKGIENARAKINNVDDENGIGKSIQEKMAIVGLWCIRTNPDERPPMSKVLEMLEARVGDLKVPDRPGSMNVDQSWDENSTAFASLRSIEISIA